METFLPPSLSIFYSPTLNHHLQQFCFHFLLMLALNAPANKLDKCFNLVDVNWCSVNQALSSLTHILLLRYFFLFSPLPQKVRRIMSLCHHRLSVWREEVTFLSDGAPDGDDEHTDDSEDQQSQDAPDHCIRNSTVGFHHCSRV